MRDAYVKTLVEIQDDVRVLIGNLEKTLEETKTALFTQNLDKAGLSGMETISSTNRSGGSCGRT